MKIQHLLLLSGMNALVHAGPARRDCGETKTFETTDLCGAPFASTWVECQSGMTVFPTFTMSACVPKPTDSVNTPSEPEMPQDALVTPPPTPVDPKNMLAAASCTFQSLCVDAMVHCGEGDKRFGTCYDTCTDKGILVTPTCKTEPLPEPTKGMAQALGATQNQSHHGDDVKPAICAEKAYMCKPKSWEE
ncbi:hypothetical protein DE146DRAFT_440335 [Phaeosphaeria sp. MPI-PUGE-AT-0046c]|nr:hypothetical protein DE146DRAFT_440335 [Phaeosphaeria sp. MPI-PUGE-AT-0046c]